MNLVGARRRRTTKGSMNTWRRVGQQSPIFDGSSMAGADGGGKELGAGHGEAVGRWREEVTGRSSQSPVTRERERERERDRE